jgi:anti-sigma factor (TIGR02949 family)
MSVHPDGSQEAPSAIDCATAVRRLWDYLDGRLSAMGHDEVEAHLATCEKCAPHFVLAERMRASLAARHESAVSDADAARLRDRVHAALARFAREGDDDRRRNSS